MGFEAGSIKIHPLVETTYGVETVYETIKSSPRVISVLLGGEDLAVDLGVKRTKSSDELFYARTKVVNACKACKVDAIDTPFTASLSHDGVLGKINCWKFRLGQKQLKHFNGIISFTKEVCKQLNIDIPCLEFAIGCEEKNIPLDNDGFEVNEHYPRKIVYAGTLIYYNGITEMLNAFADLGEAYQLHIYGYGPLENSVIKMAKTYSNIIYHGRFNSDRTKEY